MTANLDAEGSTSAINCVAGRADALVLEEERPSLVLDWKSDADPDAESVRVHAIQLRDYLRATGAPRGALVYMTTGRVHWVEG